MKSTNLVLRTCSPICIEADNEDTQIKCCKSDICNNGKPLDTNKLVIFLSCIFSFNIFSN